MSANLWDISSYAWTLIAINALQTMDNPVIPNLCSRDGSEKVTVGGKVFDVSIKEAKDLQFVSNNNDTVSELISKFFAYLALDWPWNQSIVSVGTGKLLTRKQNNWEHKKPFANNALQDKKIVRLGKH